MLVVFFLNRNQIVPLSKSIWKKKLIGYTSHNFHFDYAEKKKKIFSRKLNYYYCDPKKGFDFDYKNCLPVILFKSYGVQKKNVKSLFTITFRFFSSIKNKQ